MNMLLRHSREFPLFLMPVTTRLAPIAVDVPRGSAGSLFEVLAWGLEFPGISLCMDKPDEASHWARLNARRTRYDDLGRATTLLVNGCDRTEDQTVAATFCYEGDPFVSFRHRGQSCSIEMTPQHLPASFRYMPKLFQFQDALTYWSASA